jgi:sigma-B regulation protein RsbU (phosphoserine phosphatase)
MDRKKYYHLSNEMLTVTLIANIIGDRAINILSRTMFERSLYDTIQVIHKIDSIFLSCSFLFLIMAILWYERPVRLALKKICKQESVDQGRMLKARQRLLNEPYYIIIIDLVIWIAAAIVYGFGVKFSGQHSSIVRLLVMQSLITGLITVTLTFFWLEHILQKRLAPIFFPNGKLYITPGIVRIRVGTRLIALVMAGSIIPLLAIHFTIHGSVRTLNRGVVEPLVILEKLQNIIAVETFIFMFFAIILAILVKINISRPLREIREVLQDISRGNFNRKVRVTSNDAIGYTGDVINEMADGLKERDQLKLSLDLAMEIQQRLLPRNSIKMNGLEIAGKIIYCDETGGDYYDFLALGREKVCVAVGDVSGVVSDVNRQLTMDVEGSGQFMTLFYLTIHPEQKRMRWVRAGHEPAILYDAESDSFQELRGTGIPLGVEEGCTFEENEISDLKQGQIILLGTDGIWESRNSNGKMFGKKKMQDIIQENASSSADEIIDKVFHSLGEHSKGASVEDDITLVVVKFEDMKQAASN